MIKLTTKRVTSILTRLLYLTIASVLLVALLITLERGVLGTSKGGLPRALRSRLGSSSQAAHLHHTDEGTWTTYDTSNSGLVSDNVRAIAIDQEGNKWFGTDAGASRFNGAAWTTYTVENTGQHLRLHRPPGAGGVFGLVRGISL